MVLLMGIDPYIHSTTVLCDIEKSPVDFIRRASLRSPIM